MSDLFDKDGYFIRHCDSRSMGISSSNITFDFVFHSLAVYKVPGEKVCPHCSSVINEEDSIEVSLHGTGSHKYIFEDILVKNVKFDINLTVYDPKARQSKLAILRNCKIDHTQGRLDEFGGGPMSMNLICESIVDWHFPTNYYMDYEGEGV